MTRPADVDVDARAQLLAARLAGIAPTVRAWYDADELRRRVEREVDAEIDRVTNRGFGDFFVERLGAGEADDYLQRLVRIDAGMVLCGPRLLGGDPSKPFVDVVATTAPIDRAVAVACETFEHFRPIAARIDTAGGRPPASRYELSPDMIVCAERARAITASGEVGLVLEPAQPCDARGFVDRCYAALAESSPELSTRVPRASDDELEECALSGQLVWMVDGAQRVGLLGVCPSVSGGVSGSLIVEECVAPDFQGRGFATRAQRALAAMLAPDEVVFGTIDAANAASRRSAERAGRRIVSSTWFASSDGRRP